MARNAARLDLPDDRQHSRSVASAAATAASAGQAWARGWCDTVLRLQASGKRAHSARQQHYLHDLPQGRLPVAPKPRTHGRSGLFRRLRRRLIARPHPLNRNTDFLRFTVDPLLAFFTRFEVSARGLTVARTTADKSHGKVIIAERLDPGEYLAMWRWDRSHSSAAWTCRRHVRDQAGAVTMSGARAGRRWSRLWVVWRRPAY